MEGRGGKALGLTLSSQPLRAPALRDLAEFQTLLSRGTETPRPVCYGDGIPEHIHEGQWKHLGMLKPEEKQFSGKQSTVPTSPSEGALQKVGLGFSPTLGVYFRSFSACFSEGRISLLLWSTG